MALENMELITKELTEIKSAIGKRDTELGERVAKAEEAVKGLGSLADKVKTLEESIDKTLERTARELAVVKAAGVGAHRVLLPGECFGSDDRAKAYAQFCHNVMNASKGRSLRYSDKAVTPETDSSGGYLIPDTFVPELIRLVASTGQLQQIARKVPLGPGRTRIPKRGAGVTAYWVGAGVAPTKSDPSTLSVAMEPEKLAALCLMDNEMDDEAAIDVGQFIAFEQAYAITKKEELAMLSGDGSGTYGGITGLLASADVTDVNMATNEGKFTDLSWDYLVDLEAAVLDAALPNARYVLSQSVLGQIKKLKDSANKPIWMPPAGDQPATINGYPFTIVNQMPAMSATAVSTRFILFGDFAAGLYLGRRRNLRIDRDTSYAFDTDQTAFRTLESVDAVVVGGSTSEADPIAALKTSSTDA